MCLGTWGPRDFVGLLDRDLRKVVDGPTDNTGLKVSVRNETFSTKCQRLRSGNNRRASYKDYPWLTSNGYNEN